MYINQEKLKHPKSQRGFTLVETLVSLVILTVALIPVLNLSSGTTKTVTILRDDVIASGLSQEGIEVIHAMRDTNWFRGRVFDSGIGNNVIGENTPYRVQWDSTSLIALGSNPPLKLDPATGIYSYGAGTDTKYTRVVTITKINSGELRVVSLVSWQGQSGSTKTITAEDHLFDWK